jgi:dolichol-phosphate mannosyltransferase
MEVIHDISPMLANHFNMTVELPLKAINRGYRYAVIPINWYGRTAGVSKLSIRTLGRKYLFTVLFLWLERHLMSDEVRRVPGAARAHSQPAVTGSDGLTDSVTAH